MLLLWEHDGVVSVMCAILGCAAQVCLLAAVLCGSAALVCPFPMATAALSWGVQLKRVCSLLSYVGLQLLFVHFQCLPLRYPGVCSSSVSAHCCPMWVCSCCLSISSVYCWWAFAVGCAYTHMLELPPPGWPTSQIPPPPPVFP
jgi:hypothetical protein